MYPLYLKIQGRGEQKTTKLKRIQGDIWVCLIITDNTKWDVEIPDRSFWDDHKFEVILCTYLPFFFQALHDDLKIYLENRSKKYVHMQIQEVSGHINIKGDYVSIVEEWLQDKGF